MLAQKLIRFHINLKPPAGLPKGVEILYPQANKDVQKVIKEFFTRYFSDDTPRRLAFGINPGRFGAGITGINFTAPRQLKDNCGIDHPFGNSSELSAEFIYEMIEAYGGPTKFYREHLIAAISPLGFIKGGINLNYYDDPKLLAALKPFIIKNIQRHLDFGFLRTKCICIGGEKNYKYLSSLNEEYRFFEEIIALPHPRFIMQYRRKTKQVYLDQYLAAFGGC